MQHSPHSPSVFQSAPPVISSVIDSRGNPVPQNGTTTDTTLTLVGTAEANMQVQIFDGATYVSQVIVTPSGLWTTQLSGLMNGPHQFKARGVYEGYPESAIWMVTVTSIVNPPLAITHFFDLYGNRYNAGSSGSNNGPDNTGAGAPRGYLMAYIHGTGIINPNHTRAWHEFTNAAGQRTIVTSPYQIPTHPDGSFQLFNYMGFKYHYTWPLQQVQIWLQDSLTGETSNRFTFIFAPRPNGADIRHPSQALIERQQTVVEPSAAAGLQPTDPSIIVPPR